MSEEAIAAAFVINVNVVKQRLRLASVSPSLLDAYAEDAMTLEQLMAFSVTPDHQRQEEVWEALQNSWQKEPWQIRRMLTEAAVRASDRRAVFVGIKAYEQAGGVVLRDLFQSDDGGFLQDVGLLDRLVAVKLKSAADDIAGEGWKWVETAVSFPFGMTHGMRVIDGLPLDLGEEELAARNALQDEYNRLSEDYDGVEELPDEIDARLGELETAMAAFDDRPVAYDAAEKAVAGVFVSLNAQGALVVERGFVRPEDAIKAEAGNDQQLGDDHDQQHHDQRPVGSGNGSAAHADDGDDDDGIKPLPERLVTELTAHRTLALRDALAANPQVALTALLHRLVTSAFRHGSSVGALEASVRTVHFPAQSEDLKDSLSAQSVDDRHQRWSAMIPADDDALWGWLDDLDLEFRLDLLAHCVSFGVNALSEKPNPYGAGISQHGLAVRLAEADRLARATGLNMVDAGWKPTVGNYLGRVTKARILEAVREGAGERATQLIEHLKKGDMAKEAERLLADTGWLPEPLRGSGIDMDPVSATMESEGNDVALPDFLAGDGDDEDGAAAVDEDEQPYAVAAE
jgi:ParB family chromosome partitioning protein